MDFSEDVLGLYTDVAMGFMTPDKKYKLYIGQITKMTTSKASGGKELFEKSVPFEDTPDDLAMRCTCTARARRCTMAA